jgi:Fe-Mn family superoxide dismutase
MEYKTDELGYDFDALEPHIDKETMEVHHGKHYAGYVSKLNTALEGRDLGEKTIDDLLVDLNDLPESIRTAVRNAGGGASNHALFWKILKKDIPIGGDIATAIDDKFGSFETFKDQFSAAATTVFGSGWAWLVISDGELEIMTTPNQDSPLSVGKTPILGLDVWEHAYYLHYQNKRPDYIEAFFNVINWDQVNINYNNAK